MSGELTGPQYRTALLRIRDLDPEAVAAVQAHVAHLTRMLARAQLEQRQFDDRGREASALLAESATERGRELAGGLMLVEKDGTPASSSSMEELVAAAERLTDAMFGSPRSELELMALVQAESLRSGPLAVGVFGAALQLAASHLQPFIRELANPGSTA